MSWKKFGGIKQFDATKSFNVNSISTDDFTMREAYKGSFKILGEFFVSRDCSLNANVSVGESAIIEKDMYVKQAIFIGDQTSDTNVITSSRNGLGINVDDPVSLLDMSGSNSSKMMNVYSSLSDVHSTLLQTGDKNQTNIALGKSAASLSFVMGGNTVSIEYNLSKDLISFNRDVSFSGTHFVGGNSTVRGNIGILKNATIGDSLSVAKDVSMGRNLTIGGNVSAGGSFSITGDMSITGNATMSHGVVRKGLTIGDDTKQNGNLYIGSKFGLFFDDLNKTDAIIRTYNSNTDPYTDGSTEKKLFLNSDIVIGGNLYVDGSTNLIGSIINLGGGSGGGNALDVSGRLTDLSGTDQTRFYVNYNSNELSDNDLKGAGFYIYNNYIFDNGNGTFWGSLYNHGFVKISDVCSNKLSIRTVGNPNVVSMDLSKMKNSHTSGLLVLKHVTDTETDYNDNYDIVSGHHADIIDVSNSLTGVKNIYVDNLISCDKDVFVGNAITINGNIFATRGRIGEATIGNLYLLHDIILSDGVSFIGNMNMDNTYSENLYLSKDIYLSDESILRGNLASFSKNVFVTNDVSLNGNLYAPRANFGNILLSKDLNLSDTSVIRGNVAFFSKDVYVTNDISINGNLYVPQADVGNIYIGNLILNKDIYLSDNSVIHGNLTGTMTMGNLIADNITVQTNLHVMNDISTNGAYSGRSMELYFGEYDSNNTDKFYGYCDVAEKILAIQGSVIGKAVTVDSENRFKEKNIYDGATLFYGDTFCTDISVNGIFAALSNAVFYKDVSFAGNTNLYNINTWGTTTVRGNIDISGNLTVNALSTYNNNAVFTKNVLVSGGGNLMVTQTAIVTDVSVNNSIIIGNSLTMYGDLTIENKGNILIKKDATINGNVEVKGVANLNELVGGNIYVTNNSLLTDVSVNNNMFIGNNLTVYRDLTITHGNVYVNKDAYISGNLDITGNTTVNQLYVRKNVEMDGTLLSNGYSIFRNSISVAADVSLGNNLYVANTAKVLDLSTYGNIHVGDSLNVVGKTTLKGDVVLSGSTALISNKCTFNQELTLNNDLYCNKNIDLSAGNLKFMWNGSNKKITPEIMNSLLGVTSDVQSQIDNIKNGSDVNANSENKFTKTNTFSTIVASNLETTNLNVLTSLNMIGVPAPQGYDYVSSTRLYRNPTDYNSGKVTAIHKIKCIGETVSNLFFDRTKTASFAVIKDPKDGTSLAGDEFWAKYSYDTVKGLVDISSGEIISPTLYTVSTSVEGGFIECLHLSTLDLKVEGETELCGNIKIGSDVYTLSQFQLILKQGYQSSTSSTVSGDIIMTTNDIMMDSGDINLESGDINLEYGNLIMTYGHVDLSFGDLNLESGSVYLESGSVTAASFLASSDYRLKYDVHTISGSYYTVDNLRPVTYNFKHSGESHMGFIAHELQEHFPTAVLGEKDGTEMQSVNYAELIPVLVKEIQDLKKEVSLLKRFINIS